jgi:hypothetical protein
MAEKAEDWQNLVIAFKQIPEIVLKYLSYQCYENRNTFVDGNEAQGQRNLGRREIILLIREWLSKDPTEIPKYFKESKT